MRSRSLHRNFVLICSLLLAFIVLAGPQLAAQKKKFEPAEKAANAELIEIWLTSAQEAATSKLRGFLIQAVDQLHILKAEGPRFEAVEMSLMDLSKRPVSKNPEAEEKLLAETLKKSGEAVREVLSFKPGAKQRLSQARHLQFALAANADDKKLSSLYQKAAKTALSKKDWAVLDLLVSRASFLDPKGYGSGKYKSCEKALKKEDRLTVRGPRHVMGGRVFLPKGWKPKKKWPILVAVVGANCDYENGFKNLIQKTKGETFILVVLQTISNANKLAMDRMPYESSVLKRYEDFQTRNARVFWDERGAQGVIDTVRERFSGQEKFFMTGYSGGGFLTYYWLFHHGEQLAGACMGSCNFAPFLARDPIPQVDGGSPVLILTGSNDSAGKVRIFPQSKEAAEALRNAKFTSVESQHLKGRSHEAFYGLGSEFFKKILKARK